MSRYEFMVVPAPRRIRKLTGLNKGQDKFCATITDVLTDMGLEGWDFAGAETLPQSRRYLLIFSRTVFTTCLVFRREIERLIEPKRVERETDEPTEDARPEPVAAVERTAREDVVAHFQSGARRVSVARPEKTEQNETLDDEELVGLSALERAVMIDAQSARNA